MTLAVGVTSPRFALLGADRRITILEAARQPVFEDRDTKVVNLGGEYLLGFAGLARIGRLLTEQWVVEALKYARPQDYQKAIAAQANAEWALPPTPHAFLSVGFRKVSERWMPNALLTSNALDEKTYDPGAVDMTFRTVVLRASASGPTLFVIGAETPDPEEEAKRKAAVDRFRDFLESAYDHRESPRSIMDGMASLISEISDLAQGEIGKTCMVAILARGAIHDTAVNISLDNVVSDAMLSSQCVAINYVREYMGSRAVGYFQPAIVAPTHVAMGAVATPGGDDDPNPAGFLIDEPIGRN